MEGVGKIKFKPWEAIKFTVTNYVSMWHGPRKKLQNVALMASGDIKGLREQNSVFDMAYGIVTTL